MKIHIYVRLEDLEVINNVISLKTPVDDIDREITIFLDRIDIPKLTHTTIAYNDFMRLSDSEKINIK